MAKTRRKSNHGAAFVVGSLVGGLVGAVAALWKTPQSGDELRTKLAGSLPAIGRGNPTMNFSTTPATSPTSAPPTHVATEDLPEPPATGIGHIATTEELIRPPQPTD